MIIRKEIDMSKPLTPEQIKMLEEMDKRPVVPDEDSPAYSKEELIRLKKLAEQKRTEKQSQVVTVRLSDKSMEKAKSLGTSSTSVLSHILEIVLNNDNLLKQCM